MQPKFISFLGLFPRLYRIVPGLIKGSYHAITGSTASGKSKFAKFIAVIFAYFYCKLHNIPLDVIWFAREESYDKFWTTILSDLLFDRYQVAVTYYQIKGFHEGITPEIQAMIDELMPEIEEMKKHIHVIDNVGNPTGMLREAEKVLLTIGRIIDGEEFIDKQGNKVSKKSFVYNDPDHHVIVVNDHIGLTDTENNKIEPVNTLFLAISKWSKYALEELIKKYNCIVIDVHQQEMAGENVEHRKANLVQPTEAKLGDNKIVGRNYMYTWGLFRPHKYEISRWFDYEIAKFKKHFTGLLLIKHRDGEADVATGLYFHGITNKYEELPLPFIENSKIPNPELEQFYNRS